MTLFMLMNLGFAGSGANTPTPATVTRQSYAAIYRRSHRAWFLVALILERLFRG